jgi:hypothetical protein
MRTLHVLNDTVAARVQFVPSGMKYIYCMQSYISRHNLTRSRVAGVGQERKKFEGGGEIGGGAGVEGGTGGARGSRSHHKVQYRVSKSKETTPTHHLNSTPIKGA